ncbi:MAG: thioesterase family protein [Burkholderiales bacterium]
MTSPRRHVYTSIQPIRWGDMDAMGHVNNTVYFRYMEQTRIEWMFARVGEGRAAPDGTGPVIVNASCTFERALTYPGDVEIRMSVGERGRSSFETSYEIIFGGERCAHGSAKVVWVDTATGRSVPLPAAIAELVPGRSSHDAGGAR